MTNEYKTLFEGVLPNPVGVLATVPASTAWVIKDISLVNPETSDIHVALYRNGTNEAALMTPPAVNIVAGGMYAFSNGTISLEAGGTIAGVADVDAVITVKISGDEVSQ